MRVDVSVLSVIAVLSGLAAGCSLTDKGDPLEVRYFTPERVAPTSGGEQANAGAALISTAGTPVALRLGRIDSADYLREDMVYRDSELELGFYEDRRWTERPETYLRRALEQALFEQRGVTRATGGGATPQLSVELLAFDEVRKPKPGVLVQIKALLLKGGVARLEETIAIEQPIDASPDKDQPALVAQGLAQALHAAVQQLSDRVLSELRKGTDETSQLLGSAEGAEGDGLH